MAKRKDGDTCTCDCAGQAAAISDFKIAQFARLDLPGLMRPAPAGGAAALPLDWWLDLMKRIRSYADWSKECDRIRDKISSVLKVLNPPMPGPGMPIPPPPRPTPGKTKLSQVLEVLKAAKEAADNLEPGSARDSLREAKGMIDDEDVKVEFRNLTAGRLWYDILEELQDAIDYLDRVTKR